MTRWVYRSLKRLVLLLVLVIAIVFIVRAVDFQRGVPLDIWHTYTPEELSASELDGTDWNGYLAAEDKLFQAVQRNVTDKLEPARTGADQSLFRVEPDQSDRFEQDWNRSFVSTRRPPVGAAVFLHGLTDSPYSLRHLAETYREHGFVAIGLRLPGHGTVPGGLGRASRQAVGSGNAAGSAQARRRRRTMGRSIWSAIPTAAHWR